MDYMIYLDNPATTKVKPLRVSAALSYHTLVNSVNAGRGAHKYSLRGAELITRTADSLAKLFVIDLPERIAFVQNATLALNLAINGVLSNGGHAIVTSMEHNSVLRPIHRLGNYTMVQADGEGFVDPDDIEAAIKSDTKLIICTHASNVCGSIQPIAEIGEIARSHDILFLVDCAQTAGAVAIDVNAMNIDLLAFSGHKSLLGPLGTGGLYVGERVSLTPYITGGTGSDSASLIQPDYMPDMLHAGTLNTPAIAALGTAADYVLHRGTENILAHERTLAADFIGRLLSIDGVNILGSTDMSRRNGTVAFTFDNIDSQTAAEILASDYNIATRGGWHCAYTAHKTLKSEKGGAVRVGFGLFNTLHDSKQLAQAVNDIAHK